MVVENYLKYMKINSILIKNYKSFGNQKNMLEKRILKEFGSTVLPEITKRQIAQFHKRVCEEVSGTTGNRHLSLLSSICRYAIENDLIEKNPCVGVKKAKENKSRDRFLKEDEYIRFIKTLNTMLDNPQAQAIFLRSALGLGSPLYSRFLGMTLACRISIFISAIPKMVIRSMWLLILCPWIF